MRGADQSGRPADADPQQHLGVTRHQLENFHQLGLQDIGDGRDHLMEEFLQIARGQSTLAETCDSLLLTRPHAHFTTDTQTLGDVPAHAEHLHRFAGRGNDGGRDLEPALLVLGQRRQAILQAARRAGPQALLDHREHTRLVLRMEILGLEQERAVQAALRSISACEIGRPRHPARRDVPGPHT